MLRIIAFRTLLVLAIISLILSGPIPDRAKADTGELDFTFGNGGKVVTDFFGNWDEAMDIALEPDGEILAAGFTYNFTSQTDFALSKYTADGILDKTFGIDGKVTTDFYGDLDEAQALAIQPDGKILVVGYARNSNLYTDFALVRYDADGNLDSSFGNNGKVNIGYPDAHTQARDVALQAEGKIVVGGLLYNPFRFYDSSALARYNPDGSLDTTFGENGWVITNFFEPTDEFTPTDQISAIYIQPDGQIVVTGRTRQRQGITNTVVARYKSDGRLDRSFGSKGKVIIFFYGDGEEARDVAVQPDGKIVFAGAAFNLTTQKVEFTVGRLTPNGGLDMSFGNGGKVTEGFNNVEAAATTLTVQPDGKIVAAGTAHSNLQTGGFAVARFNRNGSLDTEFGTGGRSVTYFDTIVDHVRGIAIQPGGKIIAAGGATNNQTNVDFALARYENNIRFPQITAVSVSGKKLIVEGNNFVKGAMILLNSKKEKTTNEAENPNTRLIGKKAGKKIQPGDKLRIQNPDGVQSQEFTFAGSGD